MLHPVLNASCFALQTICITLGLKSDAIGILSILTKLTLSMPTFFIFWV